MSLWGWATELAIWTLLVGSVAVFIWFLFEVVRIARSRRSDRGRSEPGEPPGTG